jgi:cellulose synthase/poly-beta-1,6-N-acetylglucosamine synthase-like glycosyltransferase
LSLISAEAYEIGRSSGTATLNVLAAISLICAAIPAVLFAINFWLFRRPGREWNKRTLPPLSVLVPARNEERSIAEGLKSILASRGVDFELIVLDDGSTDRTREIVEAIAADDLRVRLESAPPLEEGWNGKQHACWELAGLATHDVFCYLDADVRIETEALYRMMSELNYLEPGMPEMAMVTGFPGQETRTFMERLLLPLIHFVLLGFLPLAGERWSSRSEFAAGCGQFMIVRRDAYFASGGHEAIRSSMHDGLLLPQLFRRNGFRTNVYDLSRDASCRMYRSAEEVWRGLGKNATEGMASLGRIPVFTVLLLAGQVLPFPLLIWSAAEESSAAFGMALLAFLLGYGIRIVSAWRYRQSWDSVLLHPLGALVLLSLQWSALVRKIFGLPVSWKERDYRVE